MLGRLIVSLHCGVLCTRHAHQRFMSGLGEGRVVRLRGLPAKVTAEDIRAFLQLPEQLPHDSVHITALPRRTTAEVRGRRPALPCPAPPAPDHAPVGTLVQGEEGVVRWGPARRQPQIPPRPCTAAARLSAGASGAGQQGGGAEGTCQGQGGCQWAAGALNFGTLPHAQARRGAQRFTLATARQRRQRRCPLPAPNCARTHPCARPCFAPAAGDLCAQVWGAVCADLH